MLGREKKNDSWDRLRSAAACCRFGNGPKCQFSQGSIESGSCRTPKAPCGRKKYAALGVSPADWFSQQHRNQQILCVGAEEAVSKLALGGPSALDFLLRLFPGALPQAGMDRAFGALRS